MESPRAAHVGVVGMTAAASGASGERYGDARGGDGIKSKHQGRLALVLALD